MTTIRAPRRSRRRAARNPASVALTGAAVAAVLGLLILLALRAPNGLPLVSYQTLYASVPDPGNLQPHSDVRIAGVRVGQVISITASHNRALIEMKLGSGTGALPTDTGVLVRANGLLGARYVQLIPGTSRRTLGNGATIYGKRNSLTYGVSDALDTFNRQTRGALGETLNELGVGLLGRGADLNLALAVAPQTGSNFLTVAHAVLARPGAAQRLVPSLEEASTALDGARTDITGMLSPTATALQPFIDQRSAFRSTLEQAPPTLAVAQPALDRGTRMLRAVQALAIAARNVLPAAPAGLRATSTLLNESHAPLARSTRLLQAVIPTVPAVLHVTHTLVPLLAPLRQTLHDLQPIVVTLGVHGCDINNMTSNWRSALGFGTGNGPGAALPSGNIGRLNLFSIEPIAGTNSVQGIAGALPSLSIRNVYPQPCQYAPGSTYPVVLLKGGTQ